jgi:hypothetical protein
VTLRKSGFHVCSECIVKSVGAKSQNSTNRKLHNEQLTKDHSVKMYQCNLFTVQFSTNNRLKRHAVTHTRKSELPSLKRDTVRLCDLCIPNHC